MLRRFAIAVLALSFWQAGAAPATFAVRLLDDPGPGASRAVAADGFHRLVVALESPPLAEWAAARGLARNQADGLADAAGRLDPAAPAARGHLARLDAEQRALLKVLPEVVPDARLATYLDEAGRGRPHRYAVTFNGLTLDVGAPERVPAARRALEALPGVRAVFAERAYVPAMYASVPLIHAPAAWGHPAVGGQGRAGAGIRVASMDGGVHKDSPMFSGLGFDFPPGFPKGLAANTNGKIIASRAYFRPFDPPAPGDEKPWPGVNGTSHGVHTASTAVGNPVTGSYWGTPIELSGVAPAAHVMSYRVFYASVQNDATFHNPEGIACLEDVVRDGAHVVNNSWGGGPGSSGGEGDPLDTALVNASRAGIFVSMSAGNSGPGGETGDHPSADYITVAATSTGGEYASGKLAADAPQPVPPALTRMAYQVPDWGGLLPIGKNRYAYLPAAAVDPGNVEGCNAWPAGTFDDRLALVRRGGCEFGRKALNAEQAGAVFVIVYNHATGGDALVGMGAGAVGTQVTIPAIFVGHTHGEALIAWHAQHGGAASVSLDTIGYFVGNAPDRVADFSGRGPGVGLVLKPDIAAPGVSIMAQGFDSAVRGEARHLGFGQAGGTSMAAPHVAGAAALLRQIHPTWDNAAIKSALMSTSKFVDVYTHDGRPAQPLDIGAGRLDLARAADPGVILDPPSLSFGTVVTGTRATLRISLRSVARDVEMYTLRTVDTTHGFTRTRAVAGMSVSRRSLTLAPGETRTLDVTWDAAASGGHGDRQGYLVLDGLRHQAHLPAWMRVAPPPAPVDVLVIDNDGSSLPAETLDAVAPGLRFADYTPSYTAALDDLGLTYDVYDADAQYDPAGARTHLLPDVVSLGRYRAIVYQTGDNSLSDASGLLPGASAPTNLDMNRLVAYVNAGGRLAMFGQDLAATLNSASPTSASFLYGEVLGAVWRRDSVTGGTVYSDTLALVTGLPGTPFERLSVDVSDTGDGAGNLSSIDEIEPKAGIVPLMKFTAGGAGFAAQGHVAAAHADRPTLERPRTTFAGRAAYFSFGLEGVNDEAGHATRADLLGTALDWLRDAATAVVTPTIRPAGEVSLFELDLASTHGGPGVRYRMDFGDGGAPTAPGGGTVFGHLYERPGRYTVRVEAANALGTTALAEAEVYVPPAAGAGMWRAFLPAAHAQAGAAQP